MSGILDFKYTGNKAIDGILMAVEDAAAGYHNVNMWDEPGSMRLNRRGKIWLLHWRVLLGSE